MKRETNNAKTAIDTGDRFSLQLGLALGGLLALGAVAELYVRGWCVGQTCPPLVLFDLLLVRDMLPALAVLGALAFIGADFMQAVYGLKSRRQGWECVKRRLFGVHSRKPYLLIKEGKRPADDRDPLVRVGGPGNLVIYNDSAVVLEKAGRLTRVVKKGLAKLDNFEKVWDVVDLRPQHWLHDVSAMTRDGLPVHCQADITFQIEDGGQASTNDEPYPAVEQAIFVAATRKWMREADQAVDWAGRAIRMTEGALRNILATYLLDQLVGTAGANQAPARAEILDKLRAELSKSFPEIGLKLVQVALGDITVRDEVARQQIEAWQALWKRWVKEREAEGEAARLQAVEAAKAQAQAEMIIEITQAFQSLTKAKVTIPSQLVLLRLFDVLKRATVGQQSDYLFLPTEVMKAWQLVQDMVLNKPALPKVEEK